MTDEQTNKQPEPSHQPQTSQAVPPYPPTQQPQPAEPDPEYQAMEAKGFSQILNHLLKKPLSVIHEVNHDGKNPITTLLLITLVSLAVFGLVLGIFSAGNQLWAAPVKVIGGVLFSAIICLPSLYIFGALGGMDAKVPHVIGLMLTFIAITSLLLVGFAPVVWLFSTSSNSLVFFGFLCLTIWLVCLIFGLRVISRAARSMGGGRGGHLNIWAIIFILVTIQMTTTLRPIIGESDKFLNLEEKRFFIRYWFEVMEDETDSSSTKTPGPTDRRASDD
ncbi:MAG: hypothetical protein KJO79_09965 [Verrucomicrobiae bacterium]|nr:hypothetical protein [Verrucomicrobiae bacterium]NNJ87496.1 hypothetical protein [Akkermansiaceae bacterium]